MILFDYSGTIVNESEFDGKKGIDAILKFSTKNRYSLSSEKIHNKLLKLNEEIGRTKQNRLDIEIHNFKFQTYLYSSLGIDFSITNQELESIYWNNATSETLTDGIVNLFDFLNDNSIRTGIVSNLTYSEISLKNKIKKLLPEQSFEFFITSSEYIFRKPNKRIFNVALEKANLSPDDIWYCGDKFYEDIEGSYNVGIIPVWYNPYNKTSPSLKNINIINIDHWQVLLGILKSLLTCNYVMLQEVQNNYEQK